MKNELKEIEDEHQLVNNELRQLETRQPVLEQGLTNYTEVLRRAAEGRKAAEASFNEVQTTKASVQAQLEKVRKRLDPAECGGALRALTEESEYRTKEVEFLQQKTTILENDRANLTALMQHMKSVHVAADSGGQAGALSKKRATLGQLLDSASILTNDYAETQKKVAALEKIVAAQEERKTKQGEHLHKLEAIHNEVARAQQINMDLKRQKQELIGSAQPQAAHSETVKELQRKLWVAKNATVGLDYNKVKFSAQLTWLNNEVTKLQWQAKHDFDILQQRKVLRKETNALQARVDQLKERLQQSA